MSNKHDFYYRMIIILLTVILVFTLVQSPRITQAAPQAAGAQMVAVTVLDVSSSSLEDVTDSYAKLGDLGTFSVNSVDSVLELTFHGRLYVSSFSSSAGAIFELRLDGVASTIGSARANLKEAEAAGPGLPVSITGFFSGLTAGNHTASMWVRTIYGTAFYARVYPGTWSTDVLIVKEHMPFGVTYIPLINK